MAPKVVQRAAGRFFETNLTAARIDALVAAGEWTNEPVYGFVKQWAAQRPEHFVLFDTFGGFTWGELDEQVRATSRGLLELGLRPGDVVQVQLPNWRHFMVVSLAAERVGVVVNPVAPIFRHREVAVMSELAQPKVVVTADTFRGFGLAEMHAELAEQCPWVEELVVVAGPDDSGGGAAADGDDSATGGGGADAIGFEAIGFEEFLELGRLSAYDEAAVALLEPDPNAVVELMFTSGTTGTPKGVMHTTNTLNAAVRAVQAELFSGMTSPIADQAPGAFMTHMASTLAHQTGYLFGLRQPVISGGCVVLQDVWDAQQMIDLVEQHRIVHSMGATPFLADVLGVAGLSERDLGSWQRFICAGAAIPRPVLERAEAELPCVVLPAWGMTECGAMTMGRPSEPLERRLTDGSPLAGQQVRVVDDSGAPVVGTEGDLECRGSLLFVGYAQGRQLTGASFTPVEQAAGGNGDGDVADGGEVEGSGTAEGNGANPGDEPHTGWFATGDRAVMDEQGYIKISGRSKDIVIRGGENIPVKEVEDVLAAHPGVAVVAVVAQPHDRLGEVGCAFVLATPERAANPPTLTELTEWLNEHQVTRQFWPENLVVVDELPMTPSGKVQKFKLREQLQ